MKVAERSVNCRILDESLIGNIRSENADMSNV